MTIRVIAPVLALLALYGAVDLGVIGRSPMLVD
jgi:hypothetical protein